MLHHGRNSRYSFEKSRLKCNIGDDELHCTSGAHVDTDGDSLLPSKSQPKPMPNAMGISLPNTATVKAPREC